MHYVCFDICIVCKQFMPSKQTVEGSNPSAITSK